MKPLDEARFGGSCDQAALSQHLPQWRPARARVMICDDSVLIRAVIGNILAADPLIDIVAQVGDGQAALEAVRMQPVDVVLLDIDMPVMDGLSTLPLLLKAAPGVAVIMASSFSARGAEMSMRALRMGAADCLPKPSTNAFSANRQFGPDLIARIIGLARLRRHHAPSPDEGIPSGCLSPDGTLRLRPAPARPPLLLAVGSSTGGPAALFTLIRSLSRPPAVPMVLTQTMPAGFTAVLAEHLTALGVLHCAEARDGEAILPGRITLAPGGRHLLVRRARTGLVAQLSDGPAENARRPSVDPMLRSACEAVEGRVLVGMLTGTGQDGLAGCREVVEAGGAVVAQDEATSMVWGMPGAVARAGLAHAILPLPQIAGRLLAMLGQVPAAVTA